MEQLEILSQTILKIKGSGIGKIGFLHSVTLQASVYGHEQVEIAAWLEALCCYRHDPLWCLGGGTFVGVGVGRSSHSQREKAVRLSAVPLA